jgi:hypothetical protein
MSSGGGSGGGSGGSGGSSGGSGDGGSSGGSVDGGDDRTPVQKREYMETVRWLPHPTFHCIKHNPQLFSQILVTRM